MFFYILHLYILFFCIQNLRDYFWCKRGRIFQLFAYLADLDFCRTSLRGFVFFPTKKFAEFKRRSNSKWVSFF